MRYQLDVHVDEQAFVKAMTDDVFRGLTHQPKLLPPKYFYDGVGSALFERITRLPEYYLTRVEHRLIRSLAARLMNELSPRDIVEIGSGASIKIRWLLDALQQAGHALRYVPLEIDEQMVESAAAALTRAYPFLEVHGVIGDFERHLVHVPAPAGRRLVIFFGSTIGNLDPPARHEFLLQTRRLLQAGDRLLLGVDLVKDVRVLEAAYNDREGVTSEFNRNILRVINRSLGADFAQEAFRHHAFYDRGASRIEMHLVAESVQVVHLASLGLRVEIAPGESIWTESSYKFTRDGTRAILGAAGLRMEHWFTDRESRFALALAAPGNPLGEE